jgi:acetyl esterase/lipase
MTAEPSDGLPALDELGTVDALRVLKALRELPPDHEVEPGVRAGDALTVMTPPAVPDGCRYVRDQVVGTAGAGGRPLRVHLYAAADPTERRPGVLFVHGGGFIEGFHEMVLRYAAHLAARGYVTASADYRLAGEAHFPAPVEDVKCAVRWMRAHAGEIGLDPDRLGVAGGSAGGHLAAMVGSTPGLLEGDGGWPEVSSAVRSVVLWYPGVDLRPSRASERLLVAASHLLGVPEVPEELAASASPVTYLHQAPPTLTFTGEADPIVPVQHVRDYHRQLDEAGIPNELKVFPGVGHSFDFALTPWQECFDTMATWFDETLGA